MKIPRNEGLEQLVIAGMMNDEECFYEGVSFLEEDHFTTDEHIQLFQDMRKSEEMQSWQLLEKKAKNVRMKHAIHTITKTWTTREDFFSAIDEVKKLYNKRKLYHVMQKVINAFDTIDPKKAAEEIYDVVMTTELEQSSDDIIMPDVLAKEYLEELYERLENPEEAMGMPYSVTTPNGDTIGLPSLDAMFNGAQGGDLIMIAAKTGVGKTAFAITLSRIFSVFQDYGGYYANTEMSKREMVSRLLAPVAGVKVQEMLYGRLEGTVAEQEQKIKRMDTAVRKMHEGNLVMSRIAYLPLYKLSGLTRQVKRITNNLDYLVVDYIGRMDMDENKNQWDEMYRITKGLKQLAVELNIPIFMLAQRNEAGFIEGAKKMRNECDGVLMIEPVTDDDEPYILKRVAQEHINAVNYRIVKDKVRRADSADPIYCMFDKSRNIFKEARMI